MNKIESFKVNHLKLKPGLYVSRVDKNNDSIVTTFDMRITEPNKEPVMDMPAIHTIEHLGATYLRNSKEKELVVYFGPMGCRTGFYLIMFGNLVSENIFNLIMDMCDFILDFDGDIPGAKPEECGNYLEQNLLMAKYYIKKYKEELSTNKFFVYEE